MSDDFSAKYTNSNLALDALPFDSSLFRGWRLRLQDVEPPLSPGLTLAVLRRGDVVPALIGDTLSEQPGTDAEIFSSVREAITLVAPFVGLPNVMPASFGVVAELNKRQVQNLQITPRQVDRETIKLGKWWLEMNARVYRGVGNSEVGMMIREFFPDLSFWANTTIFGYLLGGGNVFPLKEAELVVAAAIIALGATRQARSHCKAAIQLGNSFHNLDAILGIGKEMSHWSGHRLPQKVDLPKLVNELEALMN
ncbi:uncharacterized protein A1O5_07718 [Cladophialophora psammophila CBS 110553]|uniref:Carboxymuconolactone decarboxylase-like domain-containing protein n=1 Tax=Cladophialophora psammophila CBS 110553 TaxID=1182543 RepID=W9WKW2_9EURO|nr:uncharacterized protein A1O5_07718 [Cladophialophora psammophila CBS 110553]EXJ68787.1 hypothetical protein A1O5_07718 [Cladophialophora psammophila CBS 110553]